MRSLHGRKVNKKNGRKRQDCILNKVKMTFFALFLHQNATFTLLFPYLLLLVRTKDYLSDHT